MKKCFVKVKPVRELEELKYEPLCVENGYIGILSEFTTEPEKVIGEKRKFKHVRFTLGPDDRDILIKKTLAIDTSRIDDGIIEIEQPNGPFSINITKFYEFPEEELLPLFDAFENVKKKQQLSNEQIVEQVEKRSPDRAVIVQDYFNKLEEDSGMNQELDNCIINNIEREEKGDFLVIKQPCNLPSLKIAKKVGEFETNEYLGVYRKFLSSALHKIGYTLRDVTNFQYSDTRNFVILNMKDHSQLIYQSLNHRKKYEYVDFEIYNAKKELFANMPEMSEFREIASNLIKSK
jgi:hypothetical protein